MSQESLLNTKFSERMPLVFVGHGSPMNAIEENSYTQMLTKLSAKIPTPQAILVISAHWMSQGTWVLGMNKPRTIHDFYGFPQALFDVQYPAQGAPAIATQIATSIEEPQILIDENQWGLDHGTWAVLKHMYPKANIPVLQLSLYMDREPEYHFAIGQQLSKLRDQGVLILGSGNLVHNLRRLNWDAQAKPHEWAIEFDQWLKARIDHRDFRALNHDFHKTEAGRLSIPTMDHYLPLQYVIGASDEKDELKYEFEEVHNSSISMRTFAYWPQGAN